MKCWSEEKKTTQLKKHITIHRWHHTSCSNLGFYYMYLSPSLFSRLRNSTLIVKYCCNILEFLLELQLSVFPFWLLFMVVYTQNNLAVIMYIRHQSSMDIFWLHYSNSQTNTDKIGCIWEMRIQHVVHRTCK